MWYGGPKGKLSTIGHEQTVWLYKWINSLDIFNSMSFGKCFQEIRTIKGKWGSKKQMR